MKLLDSIFASKKKKNRNRRRIVAVRNNRKVMLENLEGRRLMAVLQGVDFETSGSGYSTSTAEFSDGSGDFFTQIPGNNVGGFYSVVGNEGNGYFAAMDIDGEGASATQTLTMDPVDIAGKTNLSFSVLLAEDDDSSNQDWDADDYVHFQYQIDGGGFQDLLWIEAAGITSGSNAVPSIDTDFDGVGDSTEITDTFAAFTASIPGGGSTLDIRVEMKLDAGDEDIAIDLMQVLGDTSGGAPLLNIAPVDADKAEGDSGATPFTFTVNRTGDTSGASSVDYTVVNGTTNAADFAAPLAGTLNFLANETSKTITVNVQGDTTPESSETFTVELSNATGADLGTSVAAGTIQDDDTPLVAAVINEFVFNHTGSDTDEYIEVFSPPSADLSSYSVLVIDGSGTEGVIKHVFSLATADSNGLQLAGGGLQPENTFTNGSDQSILLVQGFTGNVGDDLDTNDDGTIDTTPWAALLDDVALSNGNTADSAYSTSVLTAASVSDGGMFAPGGASRIPNGTDTDSSADWLRNDFLGDGLDSFGGFSGSTPVGNAVNTPLAPNIVNPATPGLVVTESGTSTDVSESGLSDTFTIGFNTNPTAPVTVTVTPNAQVDLGAGVGVPLVLNFPDRAPQTVTVVADDDSAVESAIHTSLISIVTTSSDSNYNNRSGSVTVNIADNDTIAPPAFINEFVVNHRGADSYDFVEILSAPNANLGALTLLGIDGSGNPGQISELAIMGSANASGYLTSVFVDTLFDDLSIVLVEGFSGSLATDLDVDDDGVFDFDQVPVPAEAIYTAAPWTLIRDAVSIADGSAESFGFVQLSPSAMNDGDSFGVSGSSRIPSATTATASADEWIRNDFDGFGLPGYPFEGSVPPTSGTAINTPNAANQVLSGLLVTPTFGSTAVAEGGAGDSVLISLAGVAPTGTVTVTVTPDAQLDLGNGPGMPTDIVFNATSGPISVDVDAEDDSDVEGPHVGLLSFAITASTDANYTVGTTAPDLSVTITDNEVGGETPTVVISEIMYDPATAEPPGEWLEIVNTGTTSVNIGGWVFDDEDSSDWGAIPTGTTLAAGQVAVIHDIGVASSTFRSEWGVPASALVIGVPWGSLSNSPAIGNEVLELRDASGAVMDVVDFDNGGAWPTDTNGPSIFLTDLSADNNNGTNWALSDTAADPVQDPVPTNPTGTTYDVTDVGSPGLVPPFVAGAISVSIAAGANGDETGPVNGRFTVALSNISTTDTVVSYTVSGTAASTSDFTPLSNTVTIPANTPSVDIDVFVIDDSDFEGTEDLTITLDSVTSGTATIAAASATINIFDNDVSVGFSAGDIIINEIMKDPSAVGDSVGEYFEIYNTTASPIDINGWTVSDAGSDSFVIANGGPLNVPAGGYLVLGRNADFATNGGVNVDYEYDGSSFNLANGDDEVILTDAASNMIDTVAYTDLDFPDTAGASLELVPSVLANANPEVANDNGLNWQASTNPIGTGGDFGTPGAVNGAAVAEINVTGATFDINDDDTTPSAADGTDFGAIVIGSPITTSFTIENEGTAALDISGITIIGADAADFAITGSLGLPVMIAPAGSISFDVTFNPTTAGTKVAEIEIANSDADESPYNFAITGSATTALVPEITVESNFTEIVDGDTTPSAADNTLFGASDVAVGGSSQRYFISNDGSGDLNISSIDITGAAASDFVIDPTSITLPIVVASGSTVSFDVDFDPSATGMRNATVEISSDDADESVYDFAISGTGVNATTSDIVINEVDADSPGSDVAEFIELYGPAGTSLDGLVLVLFNGSNDGAYDAIDLDGQVIPADGYFVIGSASVPNVDLVEFTSNGLQNGADAVGLYTGDADQVDTNFQTATLASTTNLRDALVYGGGEADDTGLLAALGETVQYNEDINGFDDTESISRVPNGLIASGFAIQAPTPGATNDAGPIDTTPPTITDVKVAGSTWSQGMGGLFNFLGAVDPGDELGYSIVNNPTTVLPWTNIDTIYIEFSEDIGSFDSNDFSLGGVVPFIAPLGGPVGDYEAAGVIPSENVTYDATNFRATIVLNTPFVSDKLLLSVFASSIEDAAMNKLDGDINGGTDSVIPFSVLPGNSDNVGGVNASDFAFVRGRSGQVAGLGPFSPFADLDGSGAVNAGDLSSVNGLTGTLLPLNQPVAPPQSSAPPAFALQSITGLEGEDEGDGLETWSDRVDSVFASLV